MRKIGMEISKLSQAKFAFYWSGFQLTHLACWLKNLVIKPKVQNKSIVIFVAGGNAPGIANAVRSATITALRNGFKVYAAKEGITSLINNNLTELQYKDVWHLKRKRSSGLKIERHRPTEKELGQIKQNLTSRGIAGVVAIGGDGTAALSKKIEDQGVKIFSLTKTIDDDILPANYIDRSFGWSSTAEFMAIEIDNLFGDSDNRNSWFFARTFGRGSGSLALEAARRSEITLAVILPEHFPNGLTMKGLQEKVLATMTNIKEMGHKNGVIVFSEGLELLMIKELEQEKELRRDSSGNVCQDQLGRKQCHHIALQAFPDGLFDGKKIILKELDYEARGWKPNKYDLFLTSRQGRAAVRGIMKGQESSIVAVKNNRINYVPYSTEGIFDKNGNLIKRQVDIQSLQYLAAMQEIGARMGMVA